MTYLIEFLRARLDEDEARARAVSGGGRWRWDTDGDLTLCEEGCRDHIGDLMVRFGTDGESGIDLFLLDAHGLDDGPSAAEHIARWDPARVLAEVEVKRRIMRRHEPDACDGSICLGCDDIFPCPTLRYLAEPHADHPDFDPAWRMDGVIDD